MIVKFLISEIFEFVSVSVQFMNHEWLPTDKPETVNSVVVSLAVDSFV